MYNLPLIPDYPILLLRLSLRFLPIIDPMDGTVFGLGSRFLVSESTVPAESFLFFFGDGVSATSVFTGDSLRNFRFLFSASPSPV